MTENPFETDVEEVNDLEEAEADAQNDLDEVDEVTPQAEAAATATKEPKAPARPAVAEGYITPVSAVKLLKEKRDVEVAPQVLYSYVNQGKKEGAKAETKLTSYSVGGRDNLLKPDEFLTWWDAKQKRVTTRAATKAEKAQKKADAPAAPAETPTVVTEVE